MSQHLPYVTQDIFPWARAIPAPASADWRTALFLYPSGLAVTHSSEILRQRLDAEAELFRIVSNDCWVDFVNQIMDLVTTMADDRGPL